MRAGTLSAERNTTSLGDPSRTITVFSNATFQLGNASNLWTKNVLLKDGATFRGVNSNEFAGPVTLESGAGTLFTGTGGILKLDAGVGGAGSLTKGGSGLAVLTSSNNYTGTTLVSAGTLALSGLGSIDTSTNITVSAGGTLDLSALASPTLTVSAGHSLGGSGTVLGSVTMGSGSTLNVGGPGTNTFGTLTITNTLLLQAGSSVMVQVGKLGATAVNSQVAVTNVTYGGTLTVNVAGGALVAGDTFKLFAAGSYNNSFGALNLPVGSTWDTSKIGVDGTIKVLTVSRPQISGIVSTNGSFSLSFTGPAGNSYRVWASTNVAATPVATTWTVVATNQFSALGTATFVDTNASNFPTRFYLISVP